MATACHGLCGRIAVRGIGMYRKGYRRCSICDVWLEGCHAKCPCCRMKTRSMPRAWKSKVLFKKAMACEVRI